MDHAYIITDKFGNPLAVCLAEEMAGAFRTLDATCVIRRPLVSNHSALEDLRKSPETPMKRAEEKPKPKRQPKRGEQTE